MESALYIVATPIGNLEDITLRAIRVLQEVDLVYAEDTRVTRVLLNRHEITPKHLRSYREAAPRPQLERTIQEILAALANGQSVAYVSDAGTPGVSDPGSYLVQRAHAEGYAVVPVPGPSALAAILSVCGQSVSKPLFVGFLPRKKGHQTQLAQLKQALVNELCDAVVIYESPQRILNLLTELKSWDLPLSLTLGRELTKKFEEVLVGSLAEVTAKIAAKKEVKGEIVLVVSLDGLE